MLFKYNDKTYEIIIEKKSIKNLYIKVKEDLKIYISCNRFVTDSKINKLINENYNTICKMIDNQEKKIKKAESFYFLGKKYDIVKLNTSTKVSVLEDKIFIKNKEDLLKWLKKETANIFETRLNECLSNFNEKIPSVKLRIRTMKTRWGVCNRANNTITLNSKLINFDEKTIDYVIYHELCHFIHPNHSSHFWNLVSVYIPEWKLYRKSLKN